MRKKRIHNKLATYCCPRCKSGDVIIGHSHDGRRWRSAVTSCMGCGYSHHSPNDEHEDVVLTEQKKGVMNETDKTICRNRIKRS
jgi:predicted RNA-binding Zn-ribbon protein involved in translation (DUF1610 family)